MEPNNQRYNPEQEAARREAQTAEMYERLSNIKNLKDEIKEIRTQRREIAQAKARMTDVKKAQVEARLNRNLTVMEIGQRMPTSS